MVSTIVEPKNEFRTLSEPNLSSTHVPALDGLRGVAILLVLIAHCEKALMWTPQSDVFTKMIHKVVCFSTCGVDLFFVLSGYLITGILLRSAGSPNYFKNFYVRRALRIFPLYYFVLASVLCATTLFGELGGAVGRPADRVWLWFYGTNIIQAINRNWTFACLNPLWSLAVEEHFYLLWPFLLLAVRNRKNLLWFCALSLPVSIAFRAFCIYALHNNLAAYTLTVCRLDALLTGCFISIFATLYNTTKLSDISQKVLAIGALIVPLYIYAVPHFSDQGRMFSPTLCSTMFGSILVLTLTKKRIASVLENQQLCSMGKYSYGVYMYHAILIGVMERAWTWTALPPVLNYSVFLIIAVLISTAVAVCSYQLYEVHFLKLKRYFVA